MLVVIGAAVVEVDVVPILVSTEVGEGTKTFPGMNPRVSRWGDRCRWRPSSRSW